MSRRQAALALAALVGLGAAGGRAAGAPGPVPWSVYRAAAGEWQARSARGPVQVPPASPLLAREVRWPDGTVQAVDPAVLKAGLAEPARTPAGGAARAGLALVTGAPLRPAAPRTPPADLGAALQSVLRNPAFASSRVGWRERAAARLGALLDGAVRQLWLLGRAASRLLARPGGRLAAAAAGLAALAAAGGVTALLLRAGLERSRRPAGRAAAPSPGRALLDAERRLAAGDVRGATSLCYREAVDAVSRRTGTRIRPGWTAADIRRAARVDALWPAFADLAAFHARVLFGPAAADNDGSAAAAGWLEEVRRWTGAAPGRASGSPSRPPAR